MSKAANFGYNGTPQHAVTMLDIPSYVSDSDYVLSGLNEQLNVKKLCIWQGVRVYKIYLLCVVWRLM